MFKRQSMIRMVAVAAAVFAAPLAAQARGTISSSDIESAVTSSAGSDRTAVQGWLQSGRVADAARGMGVDADVLRDRAASLDPASLHAIAERTRADDAQLAGGDQKIVIGTTTIIIALLIIILLTS